MLGAVAAILLGIYQISIDELVEAHVKALGGRDRIYAIRSQISHGWHREGDHKGKGDIIQMRPFYRVIGDPKTPLDGIHEGFDGSSWEFYPDPGIVVRTVGAAAAATRHGAMFDDPLVDYAKYGTKLEYGGLKTIDRAREHLVRVTLIDGFREDVYLDPQTLLIYAIERVVPMHAFGQRFHTHNVFTDYRPEGGVMMSHKVQEIDSATGNVLTEGGVDSVEVNPELSPAIFSPPQWERTPLQLMIQKIYDERDEPESVIATYTWYRSFAIPAGTITGDAVDFVGYQCLKMGHVDTAIRLLTANVADYPNSARAHFGLGRALESDGKKGSAVQEYKKAIGVDPNYKRAQDALVRLKA